MVSQMEMEDMGQSFNDFAAGGITTVEGQGGPTVEQLATAAGTVRPGTKAPQP